MDKTERLTEAKLMAVENILDDACRQNTQETKYGTTLPSAKNNYDYAKEILQAIRDEEIKQELESHEADLEEASRNKPNEH